MATRTLARLKDNPDRWIEQEVNRSLRLRSVNTRRGYIADLKAFNAWRGGRPLTRLLVEEYAAQLQRGGHSPNTVNRVLSAVRWWARRLGDLAYEDRSLDRVAREEITTQAGRVATIANVQGTRLSKGRHVTPGELAALMRVCAEDETPAGVRDAAIIGLAWTTGARRAELAGLRLADYKPDGDGGGELVVRGKGDKVRTAYIYNGAAEALADWLSLRGKLPGPLFYGVDKTGQVVGAGRRYGRRGVHGRGEMHLAGLSDEALAQMLERRAAAAGVDALTWHDFRRTFAGNLLDAGSDLATVQKLMGHSSPITTSSYDRRGDETRRKAVRSLHVPYTRRQT